MENKEDEVGYIESRPWGTFEILAFGGEGEKLYKVKRIVVNPGQRLSLQSHEKRGEKWVCADGIMTVENDSSIVNLNPGEHVTIAIGAKHRMSNNGEGPAVIIEIQTGSYLGEDDIKRYEDDYKRT
jgi:mannose-6-phosphate isomerase-like protein (cupin superfamily)